MKHGPGFVWIDDQILKPEDAKISVFDRSFLFGDSVYEVTITQDHEVLYWNEHLLRLEQSAALIQMEIDKGKITKALNQLLEVARKELEFQDYYIRVVVSRGYSPSIQLGDWKKDENNLFIFLKEAPQYPPSLYQDGVSLTFTSWRRNSNQSLPPKIKSGNYLNNLLGLIEAHNKGFDDALFLNHQDFVTEGSTFNIWMVKGKNLFTPHLDCGILEGITRSQLMRKLSDLELRYFEDHLTKDDFYNADEVFLTSATKGVVPVSKLDSRVYETPGPITQKLIELGKLFS